MQTLYFSFHTKDELLQHVHDRTVLGDEGLPPQLQPWYLTAIADPDLMGALRTIVEGAETIFARVAPMLPVFHTVASRVRELARTGVRRTVMDVRAAGAIKRWVVASVFVLVWLVAGCTHGSTPKAGTGSSSSAPATTQNSPLSARIELSSNVLKAGEMMQGQVVVTNNGEVITANGCGSLFAVALSSPTYTPQVAWTACGQTLTIPPGLSTYPISLLASVSTCQNDAPTPSTTTENSYPSCIDGHPPALPPGDYEARLYQSTHVVPDPEPVPVRVDG